MHYYWWSQKSQPFSQDSLKYLKFWIKTDDGGYFSFWFLSSAASRISFSTFFVWSSPVCRGWDAHPPVSSSRCCPRDQPPPCTVSVCRLLGLWKLLLCTVARILNLASHFWWEWYQTPLGEGGPGHIWIWRGAVPLAGVCMSALLLLAGLLLDGDWENPQEEDAIYVSVGDVRSYLITTQRHDHKCSLIWTSCKPMQLRNRPKTTSSIYKRKEPFGFTCSHYQLIPSLLSKDNY